MTEVEEKTEFKFNELDDRAKDKARDKYRSGDYPGYDWWDSVYEDAVRMAAFIGIEVAQRNFKTQSGKTRHEPDIQFSGFYSQGDGASFSGDYSFKPGAVADLTSETNDEELLRIATELQKLQLTRRLLGLEFFTATISTSGRYCHSGAMNVDVNSDEEDDGSSIVAIEETVTQLMRNFADWIYNNLENENDYLCSDDYIDERLSDSENLFDSGGNEI